MDSDKALEITVRPKGPNNPLMFAENLLPKLAGSARYSAMASEEGLVITGIWESDIETALDIVRQDYQHDFIVSQPRIHFVDEPYPMEPVLSVIITVPGEFLGDAIADFLFRRGIVQSTDHVVNGHEIRGHIPLAGTQGYVAALKRMTNGAGSATATFWKYFPVMPEPPKPRKAGAMRA